VTYLSPINQDPNKSETAETCMMEMKQILIDSGLQNDAVLVVDERIYRLCIQVDMPEKQGLFFKMNNDLFVFYLDER